MSLPKLKLSALCHHNLYYLWQSPAGLCAGSAYFNQPLIYSIEKSLKIGTSQAGLTVVLAQIGYVLGLMLLVPLGDFLE